MPVISVLNTVHKHHDYMVYAVPDYSGSTVSTCLGPRDPRKNMIRVPPYDLGAPQGLRGAPKPTSRGPPKGGPLCRGPLLAFRASGPQPPMIRACMLYYLMRPAPIFCVGYRSFLPNLVAECHIVPFKLPPKTIFCKVLFSGSSSRTHFPEVVFR